MRKFEDLHKLWDLTEKVAWNWRGEDIAAYLNRLTGVT